MRRGGLAPTTSLEEAPGRGAQRQESTGRTPGSRQPASITCMLSFKPTPALVDRELQEGSAGRQTSKTDISVLGTLTLF